MNIKPHMFVPVVSIIIIFLVVAIVSSIEGIQIELYKFNWEGVDGITNIIMTIVTMTLLFGIWQAKETHDESTKARKQSTRANDAEILRWAMDEMSKRKGDIKLVTNAYKQELQEVMNKSFPDSKGSFGTDKSRMEFIKEMQEKATDKDKEKLEKFYKAVEDITGENWDDGVKTALHTEVSIIMQRMGYMALFSLISKQHFINLWGPMFLACWYSIEWYIKNERKELGESNDNNCETPEEFIEIFEEGGNNSDYEGAFFRIHLETFVMECENKLPLLLVNNERLKFGRGPK
jgi:hypothetical protein